MKLSQVISAINHPIRRDIIKRLRGGPSTAGELAKHFDVSKPTMSVHFKTLKDAQLIYAKRDGNHINYFLNTTVAEDAMAMIMDVLGMQTETKNENVHIDRV
jgi:DNA-binding transcriptional ArsR family regulator